MNFQTNERLADVAVAGGGLAGLTAATYLARAGRDVLVFEKANEVGGRAQTQQRDDYLFNLGPHGLSQGGDASEVLDELGIKVTGGSPAARGANGGVVGYVTTGEHNRGGQIV